MSKHAPTIFLDIDGVLNRAATFKEDAIPIELYEIGAGGTITPELLLLYRGMIEEIENLSVIVSSSWRRNYTIPQIEKIFAYGMRKGGREGINFGWRFEGKTPNLDKGMTLASCRYNDIQAFVDCYEIDNFAILDDMPNPRLAYPELSKRWIEVDGRTGISQKNIANTLKLLI